jgi:hypothetical protein
VVQGAVLADRIARLLRSSLLPLLVSGCTHAGVVLVRVRTATGAPLAGATVACVCQPGGDAGAVTGADGLAELSLFNSKPETCVVTAARIGYQTEQRPKAAVCPSARRCEPIDLRLPEVSP